MQPADLACWAEQQAAELLGDLGDRWLHVQAVAAQAGRVSVALSSEDRPYLIAAAWLHDIGYVSPLAILGSTLSTGPGTCVRRAMNAWLRS